MSEKINFNDVRDFVFNLLMNDLSPTLKYHNLQHTQMVLIDSEKLARMESLDGEDLLLLKTAALFHDVGFLEQYSKNEPVGAKIAMDILPRFNYSSNQIKTVSDLILMTQLPQKPNGLLGMILCDADLSNLGGLDFFRWSHLLRDELKLKGSDYSLKKWYCDSLNFMKSHSYFTKSANLLWSKQKEENMSLLNSYCNK